MNPKYIILLIELKQIQKLLQEKKFKQITNEKLNALEPLLDQYAKNQQFYTTNIIFCTSKIYTTFGIAFANLQKFQIATKYCLISIKITPEYYLPYEYLAGICNIQTEFTNAIKYYQKAIQYVNDFKKEGKFRSKIQHILRRMMIETEYNDENNNNYKKRKIDTQIQCSFKNKNDIQQFIQIKNLLIKFNKNISKDVASLIAEYSTGFIVKCIHCEQEYISFLKEDHLKKMQCPNCKELVHAFKCEAKNCNEIWSTFIYASKHLPLGICSCNSTLCEKHVSNYNDFYAKECNICSEYVCKKCLKTRAIKYCSKGCGNWWCSTHCYPSKQMLCYDCM